MDESEDERILRQRSNALRLANAGQRSGYLLLLAAMVTFFIGLATDFAGGTPTIIVVLLAVAGLLLGPSIILGYAAKAAERYERTGETGH